MALRIIIEDTDPLLRRKSRTVDTFDQRLWTLLDDMAETMAAANGAGLAAVQLSVLRRVVLVDAGEGVTEMINPTVVYQSAENLCESEGCLSSPGLYGMVSRPKKVVAGFLDRHGNPQELTGEGLLARAICHEIDHLEGRLFKDIAVRMLPPDEEE